MAVESIPPARQVNVGGILPGGGRIRNIFRTSIEAKIMCLVALVTLAGFGAFGIINIRQEEGSMVNQQEESNAVLVSSVSNSIKTSMLEGRPEFVTKALDGLQGVGNVSQIRIFSNTGQQVFTGSGQATAQENDMLAEALQSGQPVDFYEGEGDARMLTEIRPLVNEAACQGCHTAAQPLRGAVMVSTSMHQVDNVISSNKWRTIVFMGATLLFVLLALMGSLRVLVTRPMRRVVQAIQKMSGGDFTERISLKSRDELGQLARSFNTMTDSIVVLSSTVRDTGEQTSIASHEISANIKQQVSASSEQSAAVTETTATIEELASTAKQIADTAESVARAAEATQEHAQQGHDAVSATIKGMHMINEKVNKVAEKTLVLGEKSQRIGSILEIINDIADQTNLLALNAAVEAARAGDQGRGFAVVAGEIRRLAEESVGATEKIKALIDEIQSETNSTILATEESAKEVNRGVDLAGHAGHSLESILAVVAENTNAAKEISVATQQQKSASEQVVVAMTNISEASRQQTSGARQTQAATEALASSSVELHDAIARFRLE